MMSLSNHVLLLVLLEGRETVQFDGFKNARKLDVGLLVAPMMSSRFTSDEMGHNPQAAGPAKKQAHSC